MNNRIYNLKLKMENMLTVVKNDVFYFSERILLFIYLKVLGFSFKYDYKFLYLDQSVLLEYIEKIALDLAESEDLPVRRVLFDELNVNEVEEGSKAVGVFRYISGDAKHTHYSLVKSCKKLNIEVPDNMIYPRIELTEKSDVFVLIHELGYYFLYKREQKQSEPAADFYIDEFFESYLPEFFKWIFKIDLKVRTKKEYKFSSYDAYYYYKEYLEWIKNKK
jgi:hypothetical protein